MANAKELANVFAAGDAHASASRLRHLLDYDEARRDMVWLREMLQYAVELEFTTIPPYLVAQWSIKDAGAPASLFILGIVLQEMLHMGIVCNLLNAIGGTPDITSTYLVTPFPKRLPGGVLPGLELSLRPISKNLISDVFMEIEKPRFGPIAFYKGQTFPTIGAFYSAIGNYIRQMSDGDFAAGRQLVLNRPDFTLEPISTKDAAVNAVEFIMEQGEGTHCSPLYGDTLEEKAHYYLFGELYHERMLIEESAGNWSYTGVSLPFPAAEDVYPIAEIPAEGYPESAQFNEIYSTLLRELNTTWATGASANMTIALQLMRDLSAQGLHLVQTETQPGGPNFCPCFRYVP